MKPVPIGFILLGLGVFGGPVQVAGLGAEARSSALPKWEYRVLTKDEVLKLGQKDLTAGLNKLGDAGWELVAVESDAQEPASRAAQKSAQFYFKRPANLIEKQAEAIKERIRRAEFTVTSWMEETRREPNSRSLHPIRRNRRTNSASSRSEGCRRRKQKPTSTDFPLQ